MAEKRESMHGLWSSRWTFILAASGAAVGLGNIWKFPYIAGQNGGGAFVLIYLLCVIFIGLPLLITEIMLGRLGRQNPADTFATLAEEAGKTRKWWIVGFLGIFAGFLILSYYSVIAGWALDYVFQSALGAFNDKTASQIDGIYTQLIANP